MTNFELTQKLIKVKKSCITPDQKESFKKYYQLYKARRSKYKNDFDYRFKIDFCLLMFTSFVLAVIVLSLLGHAIFLLNS